MREFVHLAGGRGRTSSVAQHRHQLGIGPVYVLDGALVTASNVAEA